MWRGPLEYITYEFALTSSAVSRMSGSSNFDNFRALSGAAFCINVQKIIRDEQC